MQPGPGGVIYQRHTFIGKVETKNQHDPARTTLLNPHRKHLQKNQCHLLPPNLLPLGLAFISTMAEQSINVPQLLVLLAIGFLVFRWFWSSSTNTAPGPAQRRINPVHVETLVQMFPQADRRSIMWELQRNGGNVQVASETILSGRLQRVRLIPHFCSFWCNNMLIYDHSLHPRSNLPYPPHLLHVLQLLFLSPPIPI